MDTQWAHFKLTSQFKTATVATIRNRPVAMDDVVCMEAIVVNSMLPNILLYELDFARCMLKAADVETTNCVHSLTADLAHAIKLK